MTGRPNASTRTMALLATALVAMAGACSVGTTPAATTTVTVTVAGGSGTPTGTSPIPTGTSPTPLGPGATAPLPTSLAVGHQRGAPHSYAEAKARVDRARVDGSIHGLFRSPSGNIRCDVSNGAAVAECELEKGRIKVPARLCPGADADRVRGIKLTDVGALPVCTGEVDRAADAPKLPYGERTIVPGSPFTCLSEEAGVTCIDTDYQRGFFIARNTFVTF